ncbi:hypothetical protein ACSNO4_00850 [Kocuria flava]|uniref:hypothetical protein n=1 Tax=Kocuria flava TaxID=446860 RepID=UPI003F1CD335
MLFVEDGPLLNFSRQYGGERMRTLFIAAARVMLISREDSAWQDVNDRPST